MIEKPTDVKQPRLLAGENGRATGNYHISRRWRPLKRIIVAAIVLVVLLGVLSGWIQKGLWMQQLGYSSVFWTLLGVRLGLFGVAFVVALLYLWIHLRVAAKNGATFRAASVRSESKVAAQPSIQIPPAVLKLAIGTIAAFAALIFGLVFYAQWDTYLRFHYGGSFGLSDPLFGVDVGFYLFRLPFYELLQSGLTGLTFIALLAVLLFYGYFGLLQLSRGGRMESLSTKAVRHLSTLLFVLVASWGWGFYLDHYELLYSTQGVVYGAGYTAGSRDSDRLLDHGRRLGDAMRAACAQFLPAAIQNDCWYRIRNLRGFVPHRGLAAASPLSEVHGTAERASPRNPVSPEQHRIHTKSIRARRDPGNLLSGAVGSDIRDDCEKRGHDPERSSLGLAAVASDVPTSSGDPTLLSVLPGGRGALPLAGWLSSGDSFDPRALRGASRSGPNLG